MNKGRKRGGGGRKRRYSRMGAMPTMSSAMETGITVLGVAGGFGTANKVKGISFLANNPLIGNLAVFGLGLLMPNLLKNQLGRAIGIGMALSGVKGVINDNAPGISETLGLAGIPEMNPYYSVVGGFNDPGPMNSIAGASSSLDNIMLRVQ